MDLALDPDIYSPSVDKDGTYMDNIPSSGTFKSGGIRCPCKDTIYSTSGKFSSHIKTKCHIKWLENLNLNRMNHFIENERLKQTVRNQQLIISNLERELSIKSRNMDYLIQELNKVKLDSANAKQLVNLIDI